MLSTSIEYPMEHSNDFALLHLHSGQSLFRFSDPKKFTYRVLRGGLALYQPRPPHSDEPIRFAFPGDVVGLGFLAHHVEHALAIADSIFACLPGEQLKALLSRDERVRDELDAATDREFEYQRKSCVERIFTPVARTANLLLVASADSKANGFDPTTISIPIRELAERSGICADEMDAALRDFAERRLIEFDDGYAVVHLLDPEGLCEIAEDRNVPPTAMHRPPKFQLKPVVVSITASV